MLLFGGTLIGMPLVTGLGRLAHRLPIAARVVARDSARQAVKHQRLFVECTVPALHRSSAEAGFALVPADPVAPFKKSGPHLVRATLKTATTQC